MLLTKTVVTKWNKNTKKHYESKGYLFTNYGDEFLVKVEDLTKGNTSEVEVLCDYCLEEGIEKIIKKKYLIYKQQNEKSIIHKDCCKKCMPLKVKESNLLVYKVESTSQLPKTINKYKQTNLDKYGVEHYSQTNN